MARQKITVVGAGNVGMDVASQAFNCGAGKVTAVDIQKPAAFGKEMEMARERWEIDSGHSGIQLSARHMMLARVRGVFSRWSGTILADPDDLARTQVDVYIDASSVETGITERWDVAVYGVARQIVGSDLQFEAVKLETRYALAAPGTWFVDPVLYLELQKKFLEDRPFSVEEKLILAKDVGRLNVSLNLAGEQEFVGGDVEPEWSYALGTSWELVPAFRLGAEIFGDRAKEEVSPGVEQTESVAWAGPAVSIAVARSWLVLAAGFGLNDQSDAFRARAILAFQF